MRSASTNSTARWPSSIPADAAASTQASVTTVAGSASPITSTSSNYAVRRAGRSSEAERLACSS